MASVFRKVKEGERNVKCTLFIGNIDPLVNETLLYELFIQFAPIKSLNLPRDRISKTHQGFGFIEFKTEDDTKYVIQILKGIRLYGKLLRIRSVENKTSQNHANHPKNIGTVKNVDIGAKLFINNLNPLIDEKYLQDTFSSFGTLVGTPIIERNNDGESKGQGFITFNDFDSSDKAIKHVNGKHLMNSKVFVTYAYKDEKNKVKHGDKVERLLASNAKKNKLLTNSSSQPKKKPKRN